MDRRNFFKIVSTVSAGVATTASCGKKSDALIPLLVADHEIVPGEEQWHPSVCTECGSGCGVIVRVMEGERLVERGGQKFRDRIACIKKVEGNPLDPVSGGRLCARGHASLQALYNPDRLTGPMSRSGERGEAKFSALSWDEAIALVAGKLSKAHAADPKRIVFFSTAANGTRAINIQRFLATLGAPSPLTSSPATLAVERKAAQTVFGWQGIPRYDLGRARYALGVGADFLGGWASPVYYGRQFGHFRQGRPGVRGKLVHADSRMSLTASNADEWLPIRPGTEPFLLLAIARLLIEEKLARQTETVPETARDSIQAANLDECFRETGIPEKRLRRVARELGESDGPLVVAGASIVHTNSLESLVISHYVNLLLGNIGKAGGVFPPANAFSGVNTDNVTESLKQAQILFLDSDNPAYTRPDGTQLLGSVETIVSFSPFMDDSTAHADWILPDHHIFEAAAAIVPAVSPEAGAAVSQPFIRPLHNTRALDETLHNIARKMNLDFEVVTPESFCQPLLAGGKSWEDVAREGGIWAEAQPAPAKAADQSLNATAPEFEGEANAYPMFFQPYTSEQFYDGRAANLPWLQELPDPSSSAMWGLPIEVDPQTATKLNVKNGDGVRVESAHGSFEAAAYVHPAALPGVLSMAIGQGHKSFGRYASGRGVNPLSILAPLMERATGTLAFGATRVRLARLERPPEELIQFSPRDREQGPWGHR